MKARPQPLRWNIADPAVPGGTITLAGWDFGGDGPIALLHHANGFCGATWGLLAGPLTKHFQVIAIDARGHGDSDAPPVPNGYEWSYFVSDLVAIAKRLLDSHGQAKIGYGIGSSFGGIITAAAEAACPGLFARIAMLDPPIHPTPELLKHFRLPMPTAPSSDALADDRRSQLVAMTRRRKRIWPSRDAARQAWRSKAMFASWRAEALELYLAYGMRDLPDGSVALKCHPDVEAHIFATTGSLDPLTFAPKVRAPLLLVRAAGGHVPKGFFESLVTLFPSGTLQELDAGHLLPMEAPELTMQALLAFAAQTAEESATPWST